MYSKIILIGRLTADPELSHTPNGKSYARFTIAVNRRYKVEGGEKEADFIHVVFWGKLAEILTSYATKGTLLSLDGELRTRQYEKDGDKRHVTEVLGNSFQFLESKHVRDMREKIPHAEEVLGTETLPF